MYTIIGADGKEYGPVPADKVRDWIANGRANADTRIKAAGGNWTTVGALPEFGAAPARAFTTPAPAAGGSPFTAQPAPAPGAGAPVELAGRGTRLLAVILDSLIAFALALPGLIVLGVSGAFSQPDDPNPAVLAGGLALLGLCLLGLLGVQIWMLSTRGQTIGKRIMGVKIVKFDDHSNPGFVHAFLLRSFVNGLIGGIPVVGGIYSLVDICFIFREDRRCIHDFIASTVVVKA